MGHLVTNCLPSPVKVVTKVADLVFFGGRTGMVKLLRGITVATAMLASGAASAGTTFEEEVGSGTPGQIFASHNENDCNGPPTFASVLASSSSPSHGTLSDGGLGVSQRLCEGQVQKAQTRVILYTSEAGYTGSEQVVFFGFYTVKVTVGTSEEAAPIEATAPEVSRAATAQIASLISSRISAAVAPPRPGPSISVTPTPGQVSLHGNLGINTGDNMAPALAAWGSASWTDMRNTFAATRFSGDLYTFAAGVDRQMGEKAVIGLAVTHERINLSTQFNNGTLETTGWTVAPYGALRLSDSTMADLILGYTRSAVSAKRASDTITGSTDSDRFMAAASLSHYIFIDQWSLSPEASLLIARERAGGYTESNNNQVAAATTRLTQIGLGGTAAYSMGAVEPYVSATYLYDAAMSKVHVAGATTQPANDRSEINAALGVNFSPIESAVGTLEVSNSFARRQVRSTTVMGSLRLQF